MTQLWVGLSSRLRKLYRKRHEVAHFSIPSPEDIVHGTRIAPFFTWGKERQKTNKYLHHDQIIARAGAFSNAARAIGWFNGVLMQRKLPLLPGGLSLQEPELIVRIRELIAIRKNGGTSEPSLDLE